MLLDEPFASWTPRPVLHGKGNRTHLGGRETDRLFVTKNIDEAIYVGTVSSRSRGQLPGRMHEVYKVDLPRPREHTDMKFLQLRHEITEASELTL